jgi:HPt (histidine-containing phosphotransfer) domain-containing protein
LRWQHLPTTLDAPDAVLDDAQALSAAGGDMAIVAALRGLFATELDALPAEIEALAMRSDIAGLRDRLHRLDASAGFCGAPTLQAAISRLRRSLDGAHWPAGPLDGFLATCARVRDALGASGAPESHG